MKSIAIATKIVEQLQKSLEKSTWGEQYSDAHDNLFRFYKTDMIKEMTKIITGQKKVQISLPKLVSAILSERKSLTLSDLIEECLKRGYVPQSEVPQVQKAADFADAMYRVVLKLEKARGAKFSKLNMRY